MWEGIKAIKITTDSKGIHYTWEIIATKETEQAMKNWVVGEIYDANEYIHKH